MTDSTDFNINCLFNINADLKVKYLNSFFYKKNN